MSTLEDTRQGGNGYVGQAIRRKEDPPLITGRGRYVDDIRLPGTLHAAIVRSPHAHARITSIDASEAESRDDVHLVLTGEDLKDLAAPLPMAWAPPGVEVKTPEHWPLARGKVCHVGDPVAVVVADTKYGAVDAAEGVFVEYEELPVVIDPEKALEDGSPVIHEQFGTNHSYDWSLGGGDVEKALAEADVVVERRVVNHRTAGAAIEPRAAIAEWRAGYLTLYTTTQVPHLVRLQLAGVLAVAEDRFRVVAPDVGGGFGSKLNVYGEEALVSYLSRRLEQPVRWTATRSEDMAAAVHGRDQIDYARMGLTRDGKITALHAKVIADMGAYHQLLTP
ncbi:MAG: aerobic carbon-monoxide dehydrogenase large subunit, partial [Thermoleophilaceae bacterium]|nr:aerobic carbon-monoxide dehydrogenase large subunit [Thermoleophilaceae bacterium]